MSVSVKVINRIPQYQQKSKVAARLALRNMANDVIRLSKMQVPLDTGRLQSTGKFVGVSPDHITISYATPYARRWHFENANFKHGRKSHYLSDPAKLVSSKAAEYFRGALS